LLVGAKLVAAVASAGCNIGGVMIIVMRAMTTGPILGTQYRRLISSSCHLVNIILLTPVLVIPSMRGKHKSSQLKTSRFIFLDRPFQMHEST
jgi:hypothetical protein